MRSNKIYLIAIVGSEIERGIKFSGLLCESTDEWKYRRDPVVWLYERLKHMCERDGVLVTQM